MILDSSMMMMRSTSCSSYHGNEAQDDLFDLLPDAILLEIFNRVHDANSLSNCISTCKRFASLIPQVNVLHLALPSPSKNLDIADVKKPKLTTTSSTNQVIKGLISKIIFKPIQSLLHTITPKKFSNCSHCENDVPLIHLPNEILRNFNEIRSLRVELPKTRGDISSNSGDALLKWKAEFGSELQSCVILGANSFDKVEHRMFENPKQEEQEQEQEQASSFSNDKLKLRVVWTISCLIAASARHHLLKQILSEHLTIEEAEMTDGSKQGKICMQKGQVEELRKAMNRGEEGELEIERTKVPALRMKMWYVPELELPASGCVLKGATLVVIRPAEEGSGEIKERCDADLATSSFDGEENWIGEASRKMIKKKKAFTLEMNSF